MSKGIDSGKPFLIKETCLRYSDLSARCLEEKEKTQPEWSSGITEGRLGWSCSSFEISFNRLREGIYILKKGTEVISSEF